MKEEKMMKKLLLLLVAVLIFSGCASVRESGFYEHDTRYASWSHMKFSLWGYKKQMDEETMKKAIEEGWWGIEIPHSPE
jgi:uncharacterized protein YceK